jgi:hypothetical protein
MMKFWNKKRNGETLQDMHGFYQAKRKANTECEEEVIRDKQRFGRVRKSTMQDLRKEYGVETANRALWRVSKRETRGCLQERNL